jgi:hypothetical protein
VVLP